VIRLILTAGLAAALTLIALSGCQPVPTSSDPDRAREILRYALNAWKNGEHPNSLKQARPPVTAADRQWEQGMKLLDYEITRDGQLSGFDVQFSVRLSLQDVAGKPFTERAIYNVSTTPAQVVVRTEPGS
jgi:hypothetical protein